MSEQTTPETDALLSDQEFDCVSYDEAAGQLAELCSKLERERDEAREAAAKWESSSDAMERAGAEQARRADENREWAVSAERERDEARKAFAIATTTCVDVQRRLRVLERERDEAREDAKRATYDAAQETIKVSTVKSHWIEACREHDKALEALREIQAAAWKTAGELRGMARKALEAAK